MARTTVGLPNLQGRAPLHPGTGPGIAKRNLGQRGGTENQTLTEAQLPSHVHTEVAVPRLPTAGGGTNNPANHALGLTVGAGVYGDPNNLVNMASDSLGGTGGSDSHNNMQPFLTLNFIIALDGLFPERGLISSRA